MNYLLKSILSLILIVLAAINFYTMYELLGRKNTRFSPEALRIMHRFSGYFFILLFLIISYLCLAGVVNDPFDFTPQGIVHTVY
jgi:Trk-type K+ transport system membrane component